jgi:glutaredoxin
MPEHRVTTLVTVVVSPSCHFCVDAERVLAELGRDFPLAVTVLDIGTPEGAHLVQQARAPMSPLVLVDGEVFSWGRLPGRKLRRLLDRRMTPVVS